MRGRKTAKPSQKVEQTLGLGCRHLAGGGIAALCDIAKGMISTTACFNTHWQSVKAEQAVRRSSLSGLEARVIVRKHCGSEFLHSMQP